MEKKPAAKTFETALAEIEKGILGGWNVPFKTLGDLVARHCDDKDFGAAVLAMAARIEKKDAALAERALSTIAVWAGKGTPLERNAVAQWETALETLAAKNLSKALQAAAGAAVIHSGALKTSGARRWKEIFNDLADKNPQAAVAEADHALKTAKMFRGIESWGPDATSAFEDLAREARHRAETKFIYDQIKPRP